MNIPRIGDDFVGYRIEALIGRGGMSVVYRAENLRIGSTVALKILAPELGDDDVFRERFVRESRVAATSNHPNIITIYDAGSAEGLLYIVMRFVDGPDLKALLKREGPLELPRVLSIFSQVGSALDAGHARQLIHRDVKPANILIDPSGDPDSPDHVYLTDFGLTKHSDSHSGLTATGQFVGTIDYCPPEQIQGKPLDGRADVYSLGCVLYECLTGVVPFRREVETAVLWAHVQDEPEPPSRLRLDLPSGLDAVVARAMAKAPGDRYGTCRALVADLRREIRDAGNGARTPPSGIPGETRIAKVESEPGQAANPVPVPAVRDTSVAAAGRETKVSGSSALEGATAIGGQSGGPDVASVNEPIGPTGTRQMTKPDSGPAIVIPDAGAAEPTSTPSKVDPKHTAGRAAAPRTWRSKLGIVALVTLLVAGAMGVEAFLLTRNGQSAHTPGPSPTSMPTDSEHVSSVDAVLLEHIPKSIQESCTPGTKRDEVQDIAYSHMVCKPANDFGLKELQYNTMHDRIALQKYFGLQLQTHNLDSLSSHDCSKSPLGVSRWLPEDAEAVTVRHVLGRRGVLGGKALCYTDSHGVAWIEWYDSDTNIYAWAAAGFDEYQRLFQWWQSNAGPDHPRLHGDMSGSMGEPSPDAMSSP